MLFIMTKYKLSLAAVETAVKVGQIVYRGYLSTHSTFISMEANGEMTTLINKCSKMMNPLLHKSKLALPMPIYGLW